VPLYHQQHTLSCEESSLSMVLAYEGAPPASTSDADQRAREDEILGYIGVDTAHWWAGPGSTETADRRAVAGDPFAAYVGNVDGSERLGVQTGYGTYYPTIAKAAEHFGAPVVDAGDGITPAQVYAALREGRPAIVWLTYDLQPHGRDDYVAADGRTIPYAGPWEHTMVVTGIDDTGVRVNDPDRDQYWITFAQFEAAYAVYGDMAIVFDRAP
jgi:uncharacterized protein YvpB